MRIIRNIKNFIKLYLICLKGKKCFSFNLIRKIWQTTYLKRYCKSKPDKQDDHTTIKKP